MLLEGIIHFKAGGRCVTTPNVRVSKDSELGVFKALAIQTEGTRFMPKGWEILSATAFAEPR